MSEVTHVWDDDMDGMRQVVPPHHLRAILERDGESLSRPKKWGPRDEWDVGSEGDGDDD